MLLDPPDLYPPTQQFESLELAKIHREQLEIGMSNFAKHEVVQFRQVPIKILDSWVKR